jgi:hypothetical protein
LGRDEARRRGLQKRVNGLAFSGWFKAVFCGKL